MTSSLGTALANVTKLPAHYITRQHEQTTHHGLFNDLSLDSVLVSAVRLEGKEMHRGGRPKMQLDAQVTKRSARLHDMALRLTEVASETVIGEWARH